MARAMTLSNGRRKMEEKSRRGGKREGAGRKPSGIPPRQVLTIRVSEEERTAVRNLLRDMRRQKGED